ncbi:MAG: DUF4398 domain-containing protein [Methylobacter sp.]
MRFSILAAMFIAGCATIQPPDEQIAASKNAIKDAADKGSREFAPEQLESAQHEIAAAEQALNDQDYLQAWRMAERARIDAELATAMACTARTQIAARKLQEINLDLERQIDRQSQ